MKKMCRHFTLLITISALLITGCGKKNGNNNNSPKEGTILYRSYQLANNVEKLPSTKDIYGGSNTDNSSKKLKKNAVRDETDPSEDVTRFPAYSSYYAQLWGSIDGQVEDSKEMKNYVVKNIYTLNTWINTMSGTNYRLNYDSNRDAAIIEAMYEESDTYFSYRYIYTTYDQEGRMLIDSVWSYMRYENNEIKVLNETSVSYVEGLYWDCTILETQEDFGEGGITYNYVIHANLAKEEKEITQIQLSTIYKRDGSIEHTEARPSIQTTTEHLYFVTNNDNNGNMYANIYDKKGYNYIEGYSPRENESHISIPLYRLTGYDKIENHYRGDDISNGTRYFTVGNKTYGGESYEYNGLEWRVSGMVFGPGVEPAITIDLNYANYNEKQAAQLIRDFLSSIGLSYKEDYLEEAFHLEMNKRKICEEREAFGKKNYLYITNEEFNTLYEHYVFNDYDVKDLKEYLSSNKIDVKNQTHDDGYYSLVNSASSGSYTFDQDNRKISIGEITLSVEKNALLDKDIDYVGVTALKSGREVIVLKESDAVRFDGVNDISVVIPSSSYDIENLPANNDESFEVVAYLATKDGNNLSRCSSVSPISYQGEEVNYLISVHESKDNEEAGQSVENSGYVIREYFSITKAGEKVLNKHYFILETALALKD